MNASITVPFQADAIRDYVFPLITAKKESDSDGWSFVDLLGTGFLIGTRGFALTAAHLFDGHEHSIVAIFVVQGEWRVFEIVNHEIHAREDVALIRLTGGPWKSIFRLSNTWEGSSARYRMFGYPADVATELNYGWKVQNRPDLVYAEGYVRRRISGRMVPSFRGTHFLELSEVAGAGCSGAPVFKADREMWPVIGVYCGECQKENLPSVAYAVREDAFRDWQPTILGTSILKECLPHETTPEK